MIVTIHQPEHMPWLGFFNKAMNCDVFVLLDTVQFEKNYFQNRNQIASNKKEKREWITVPLKKSSHTDLIREKKLAFDKKTKRRYFQQIERAYKCHPYYDLIEPIKDIFEKEQDTLSGLNVSLIKHFFDLLGIKCKTVLSSELDLVASRPGGEVNFDICKKLNATVYLSGKSGKDYLDTTKFVDNSISVLYQDFMHPTYNQLTADFVSNLSILDLIFSLNAPSCFDIIKRGYRVEDERN
jgi:hypothetical protein